MPYLSGRKVLGVGLLLTWWSLRGALALHERSPRAFLLGIAFGMLSIGAQLLADRLRELMSAMLETFRALERRLDEVASVLVTVIAGALILGLFGKAAGQALTTWASTHDEVLVAGLDPKALALVGIGAFAYAFSRARTHVSSAFDSLPLAQERGVRRAVSFAASLASLVGVLTTLTFPWVGAAVAVMLLALVVTAAVQLGRLSRGKRGSCEACHAEVHLAAQACGRCHANRAARAIGVFGRVREEPATDLSRHRLALLSWRRCPSCAEALQLGPRAFTCRCCGAEPFADLEQARAFARHADARVVALAPVLAALSLLPIVGLAAALLAVTLSASGAMRRYSDWQTRLRARAAQGVAVLLLAALQPIPAVGALATVALVMLLHVGGRRSFLAVSAVRANQAGAVGTRVMP